MSDAIREAFEALERVGNYVSVPFEMMVQFADDLDTVKTALQSQTAPAVPDELHKRLMNLLCSLGHQGCDMGDGQIYDIGEWGIKEAQELHTLLAAPQPDHSTDAGKVVPGLSFRALREANAERINSSKYEQCERHWTPAHWMQATVGELGELANLLKKVDRGDFPFDQVKDDVARELADVQTYLYILALKLGVDLGQATIDKFNEVSERIGSHVTLTATPSVPEEETGKVVQCEPMAVLRCSFDETGCVKDHWLDWKVGAEDMKDLMPLYTHPAESREVIQAQALDWGADRINGMTVHFACASAISGAVAVLRSEAARLRASQQEGGEG